MVSRMTNPRIKINHAALRKVADKVTQQKEDEANAALQKAITEVNREMRGKPFDEVYPVLKQRVAQALPGFSLHDTTVRGLAGEISTGRFKV